MLKTKNDELLIRIVSSYFVAGAVIRGNRCVEAAPILHSRKCNIVERSLEEIKILCGRRRWTIDILNEREGIR